MPPIFWAVVMALSFCLVVRLGIFITPVPLFIAIRLKLLCFSCCFLKAAPGFEPGVEVLQTSALPLGYAARLTDFYISSILLQIASPARKFLGFEQIKGQG